MSAPSSKRRSALTRTILVAVVFVSLLALGVVQVGSDALMAAAAQPGSLPTHVPIGLGLRIYRFLDRIAPAPFVASTLARYELRRDDVEAAQRYALSLPATPERNELLAQIALARGEHRLAYEYFFVAPDIAAVQREVQELSVHEPDRAYVDELRFKNHLAALTTHPDAVAQAYWMLGRIATQQAELARTHAQRTAKVRLGLNEYRKALALAPLNMTYVLAAANQALALQDTPAAYVLFRHGTDVNPASADALAGLGIIALRVGNRARAQSYAAHARALNAKASELLELEKLLR